MLSFGTGFVLGSLFRDKQCNPLLKKLDSDYDWWEFHMSCLYADVQNGCIRKWATDRGYDLQADEKVIEARTSSYPGYREVLDMMLASAKSRKKRAKETKNDCKRNEAKSLIKMIKERQKLIRG